jgi:hypothetical protein
MLLLISTAVEAQVGDPTPIRRTVAHPPVYVRAEEGLEGLVDEVLRLWPESALMIAEGLGLTELAPVEIVLLKHSTWTRWSRGLLPEWGVGFANWPGGPIAIDAGRAVRDPGRFSQILRHEISHVYLGQRLNGHRPPTWFVEGVAQIQSGDWSFGDTMGLVQVASAGALPPLSRLQASFPVGGRSAQLAYRVSRQAVLEIDRRGAERGGWRAMLGPLAAGESFDSALAAVSGLRMTAFEAAVENRLRIRYGWLVAVASASSLFTFMTLLFVVGAVRARLRTRQRLREMEDEEALLGFDSTT